MEVVVLGSGSPQPDPCRCGSGVAVVNGTGWVLVDCGRGVTQRMLAAGFDLTRLDAVLLTHHHSDHVSDLATLAITRWVAGAAGPIKVIAPEGPCARFARSCLDGFEDEMFHAQGGTHGPARPTVVVDPFTATGDLTVVLVDASWAVSSVLVDHHPIEAAVGYRIESGEHVVAVSGDTRVCPGVELLATGADLLVHEALRSDRVSPSLLEWNASARSVGELGRRLAIPKLVLTHLIPAPDDPEEERAFIEETRAGGYQAALWVAVDGLRLDVTGVDDRSDRSE